MFWRSSLFRMPCLLVLLCHSCFLSLFVGRSVGRTAGGFVFPPPIVPLLLFYHFYYLYLYIMRGGGFALLGSWFLAPFLFIFSSIKKTILYFSWETFFFLFISYFSGIECDHDGSEEVDSSSMTERIEGDWIHNMNMGGVLFCCSLCYVCLIYVWLGLLSTPVHLTCVYLLSCAWWGFFSNFSLYFLRHFILLLMDGAVVG